jgi:hypothetical protein
MKKKLFSFIFTLFLAVPSCLYAQNGDFMPHVSGIRAESRNNLIRISWVDSPEARGPVYIYRSARPFRGSIPPNSRPVVVRYGEQSFIDDTDDMENLYYYVVASDTSGRRFDTILPQINSTNVNLAASPSAGASPPSSATASPEEKPVQKIDERQVVGVSNLRARQDGDRVIITFDIFGPRKNAVLYRSIQPLRQPYDLLNAVIVQSGVTSPFVDSPVPGLSWYYAVIFEDEVAVGNVGIRVGGNATSSAVIIPDDGIMERPLRPIPLPVMTTSNAMPEGYYLSERPGFIPMSGQTQRMIETSKVPPPSPPALKNPRVFAVDLQAPTGGEESALFQIVKEYFEKRDWEGSRLSLLQYLSLPRSKDVEARARFYLGQALYFTGDYKGALFEFLSIKSLHPIEANIWIDAILTAMVSR